MGGRPPKIRVKRKDPLSRAVIVGAGVSIGSGPAGISERAMSSTVVTGRPSRSRTWRSSRCSCASIIRDATEAVSGGGGRLMLLLR